MHQDILETLTKDIYTDGDLRKVIQTLRGFFEYYYFKTSDSENSLHDMLEQFLTEEKIGPVVRVRVKGFIAQDIARSITKDNLYDVYENIFTEAKNLPHIVLFVAVHLEPEHIKRIGEWLREHVAPNMMMTLKHDATAVGGCSFVWNGNHYDYSLRYFIDKERPRIVESLNEYYAAKV